jgi:hypothetical protein
LEQATDLKERALYGLESLQNELECAHDLFKLVEDEFGKERAEALRKKHDDDGTLKSSELPSCMLRDLLMLREYFDSIKGDTTTEEPCGLCAHPLHITEDSPEESKECGNLEHYELQTCPNCDETKRWSGSYWFKDCVICSKVVCDDCMDDAGNQECLKCSSSK